jgi:methyl-accepting chemotaxis protein
MSDHSYSPPRGWGGRIGVGHKLKFALGGLVTLVAIALILAVVLVARLGRDETRLNRIDIAFASAADRAALQAKGVANDERGFLMSGDHTYLDEAARRITAAKSAFDQAVQTAAGTDQREAITRASTGFGQWVDALQQEFAAYDRDKAAAISASLGGTRDLRKNYEAELNQAQNLAQTSVSAAASNVSITASRSVAILLACLALVLFVGLLVSTWVIRFIAIPLHTLANLLVG